MAFPFPALTLKQPVRDGTDAGARQGARKAQDKDAQAQQHAMRDHGNDHEECLIGSQKNERSGNGGKKRYGYAAMHDATFGTPVRIDRFKLC